MAPNSASATRRGRQLLAVIIACAALLAAASTLLGGAISGHADDRSAPGAVRPAATAPCKKPFCPSPSPSPSETPASPSPTPTECIVFPDFCPTPTPSVLVVTPVAPDPTPTPTTPSYLQGAGPSPTVGADGSTVISSPVPLGGGFVDQLPTPSQRAPGGPPGDLAPHQSGLPLPFLVVGILLILGAVGSLIYAIAPREKPIFTRTPPGQGGKPVMFTPYGSDAPAPGTNLLNRGQPPPPGPKKPT